MGESFVTLPDGSRLMVFQTSAHPDISGTINIQSFMRADIPTYQVTADNVQMASGKNLLSVFNNLPNNRIRVQHIDAYPRTSANNSVTLHLNYINSVPSGGQNALINLFAADFPPEQAPPNNIWAKVGNTLPAPISGIILGGTKFGLNLASKQTIFSKTDNGSSLELRPTADGVTVKQMDGLATGTANIHLIFTLD